MKLNQKGFSAVEGFLVIVIVGMIGFTGWFMWNAQKKTNTALDNSTKSQSEPQKTNVNKSPTIVKKNIATTKYLTINEWGIKFALSENIKDAYYDAIKSTPMDAFSLRVHSLDTESECKNGSQSIVTIFRVNKDEPDDMQSDKKYTETMAAQGKLIGNYFYFMGGAQYSCVQKDENNTLLGKVRKEFIDASSTIEKI